MAANDARSPDDHDRAWGVGSAHHDRHVPADPHQRQACTQLNQFEQLTPQDTQRLAYSVLNEGQKQKFEEENELDLSFGIQGLARFRCNVYRQRGAVAAAIRVIPYQDPDSFEELNLPPIVEQLADRPKGLVLVTGPTGSGKSTTLAAMIDKINSRAQRAHHDDRGPDRVRPPAQAVPRQPARGLLRHPVVQERAQVHPPPGPGRGPRRRDARPGDDRGRADDRRDRPPDVRHAPHELLRPDDEPHHRRVPDEPAGAGAGAARRSCWKACSPSSSSPPRTAAAA